MAVRIGCALTLATVLAAGAAPAATFTTLYDFQGPPDGRWPGAAPIPVGSLLYGATFSGGAHCARAMGCGSIYTLDPASGAVHIIHSFPGGPGGDLPNGSLLQVGNSLYGVTFHGGSSNCKTGCGTVYALDLTTNAVTTIYKFAGGQDGAFPSAGLTQVGTLLYGTTYNGGGAHICHNGCGTVFSLDPATGKETVLHAFQSGTDGAHPAASLTSYNYLLYGTTLFGGRATGGTLFAINPRSGRLEVLHHFSARESDSRPSNGGLTAFGGQLYGTAYGPIEESGAIYAFDPVKNELKVAYTFGSNGGSKDGLGPSGNFAQISGVFYGTTSIGGTAGFGTIYSFDPATGAEQVLYSFSNANDGCYPSSGPAVGTTLYGTTGCGSGEAGTVFSFTP